MDTLNLGAGRRLAIVSAAEGMSAAPLVHDGTWRRARPGDGAAEALLELLAAVPFSQQRGRFTLRSWTNRTGVGEVAVGVDQTNESVIVGGAAVVKWATHLQQGPHPAPQRIDTLRDAGFTGMPSPWGLVTWRQPDGAESLVAYADEFLAGAVDGWTWAVQLMTAAALDDDAAALTAATAAVGSLIAELHAALAATASVASEQDAGRWYASACDVLETACALGDSASASFLRSCREQVAAELGILAGLGGATVIDGHGDLHVGQVLRSGERYLVTDFDGNPVLPAEQRALPIPAVLDVAGMDQSLAHVAIVARRHTRLDAGILAAVLASARRGFLDSYRRRLSDLGQAELYDPGPHRALRIQQVLREMIYAAKHLPRWMYVPDAALPALLDDRTDL